MALDKPKLERTVATIGESLIATHHCKTIKDTAEMWYYSNDGLYKPGAEQILEQTVRRQVDREISKHNMAEILYYVKTSTYIDRSELNKDLSLLNLKNGVYNLATGKLEPHSPDQLITWQFQFPYDLKAWPHKFVKFLLQVLMRDDVKPMIKMLGYILLRKADYETGLIEVGEGRNGKSTLQTVIEHFAGPNQVAHVPMQDMSDDKFAKADLFGKMVNLVDDLDVDSIVRNTSYIKSALSGKPLRAQRKHGHAFDFENYAVFIIAANKIPETKDKSYAWLRRWLVIEFSRVFEGDECDPHLAEKLTTEQELSGIFNLALMGLRWLKDDGGFKETDMEEIRRKYLENTSRIKDFIKDKCELAPGNDGYFVESSLLREEYRKYCISKGTRYYDERKLGEELKSLGVMHRQKTVAGKGRPYHDFGLRLKGQEVQLLNYLGKPPSSLAVENNIIERKIVSDSPKQSSKEGDTT